MRAGEVVSMEDAERRTVRLLNPALRDRQATTHTILSFQYVKTANTQGRTRHTARRFALHSQGEWRTYTTVNGQKCVMEEGDLIRHSST